MKTDSTLKVINKKLAAGLLALALGVAGSAPTHAQPSAGSAAGSSARTYPERPVRIVVPLPAGGSTDIIARALALRLTDAFGQTFVVDNRPSAGSLLALDILASSAPDGYTLMVIGGTTVMYPAALQIALRRRTGFRACSPNSARMATCWSSTRRCRRKRCRNSCSI